MAAHHVRRSATAGLAALTLTAGLTAAPGFWTGTRAAASPMGAAAASGVPAARPSLVVLQPRDLGGLPGARISGARDVNRRGQVVGASLFGPFVDEDVRPFLWERGVMRDLGLLGGRSTRAVDINDLGQVLLETTGFEEPALAGVWHRGRTREIGGLGPGTAPVEINDRGQVLANSYTDAGVQHAVLWQDGRLVDLGLLPGGRGAWATDLNERGDVVGVAQDAAGEYVQVLWQRGRPGPVPLAPQGIQRPVLNERGAVALTLTRPGNVAHAAVWSGGRLRAETTVSAVAGDINDRGVVVGLTQVIPNESPSQAMVWRKGQVSVLPKPDGFDLSGAGAINNRGQILGNAGVSDHSRPFQPLVWQDRRTVALAPVAGRDTAAAADGEIDDRGRVPGISWSTSDDGADHGTAVLWTVPATIGST